MAQHARKTIDDLRALGEDSRFELIHGEITEKAMSRREHALEQTRIATLLSRRFGRAPSARWPGGWWIQTELHVVYDNDQVFCHDVSGHRRDLHAHISNDWPCPMRPDWVCELLSPNHHKRDRIDKASVLFRAQVPHYWIVNPEERILEVLKWTPERYVPVLTATSGQLIRAEPFEAVELRTDVLFGLDDDEE